MKGIPDYLVGVLRDVLEHKRSDSVNVNFSSGGVRNVERAYALSKEYDIGTAILDMIEAGGRYEYRITVSRGQIEKQRVTEFLQPSKG